MLLNTNLKFVFVDTPLSISAIRNSLLQYVRGTTADLKLPTPIRYNDLKYLEAYQHLRQEDYWSFGVIRNPFDYMIALYEYYVKGSPDNVAWCRGIELERDAVRERQRLQSRGFDRFVLGGEECDYAYLHSRPFCGDKFTQQSLWLDGVDNIYTFENITPLLNDLFERGGGTLPSYNDGDHVPHPSDLQALRKKYYTNPDVVELITIKFQQDFQIGGYSPLSPH
jgi:hypothetical protein